MRAAVVGDGGWAGFGGVIGAADLRMRARISNTAERRALGRRVAVVIDDTPLFAR